MTTLETPGITITAPSRGDDRGETSSDFMIDRKMTKKKPVLPRLNIKRHSQDDQKTRILLSPGLSPSPGASLSGPSVSPRSGFTSGFSTHSGLGTSQGSESPTSYHKAKRAAVFWKIQKNLNPRMGLKLSENRGSIIPPASPSVFSVASFKKHLNFELLGSNGKVSRDRKRRIQRRLSDNRDGGEARANRRDMLGRRVSMPPVSRRDSSQSGSETGGSRRNSEVGMNTVLGLAKWRMKIKNEKRVTPLQRFRRIARIVKGIIGYFNDVHKKAAESEEQLLAILQFSPEEIAESYLTTENVMFDPSAFKTSKKPSPFPSRNVITEQLPQEARRILQMAPQDRSEKDLNYLLIALRSIEAFAKYPMRMQRRLIQVGWYERYEARRAIVKQGHPPQNFYVILSGSLVVTVLDETKQTAKPVAFLQRGMAFGELALITRSIRQGTVITRVPTELLVISVEDFEDIFMSGGTKNLNDPDYNAFIRSISFLKSWPLHLLNTDPKSCMFNYFNRGQVLVRDSQYSDWIYIVKSGSVSVMKKFRKTEADFQQWTREANGKNGKSSNASSGRMKTLRRRNPPKQLSLSTDSAMTAPVFRNQIEMDSYLAETLPGYFDKSDKLGTIDYDSVIEKYKRNLKNTKSSEAFTLPRLVENVDQSSRDTERTVTPDEQDETEKEVLHLPAITKNTKGVYLAATKRAQERKNEPFEDSDTSSSRPSSRGSNLIRTVSDTGIKTITDQMENKPRVIHLTEADLHPMFVRIQVLERGQYFGVRELIFNEQPSLSVVSNGAECIMVSKKYFKEHASERVMQHLRKTEVPYPDNEELQRNLQNQMNWEAHRAHTYNQVALHKQHLKSRKRQFNNQFIGQYNFRAGPV